MKVTELIWKFLKWQHLNAPLWVGSVFILMGAVTISRTEKTEIEYLIAVMVLLFGAGLVFLNNLGWNIYDMLEEKLENNTSNLAKK